MTREKEINAAALKYIEDNSLGGEIRISSHKDSFIEGADWADANPVLPWISVEDDLPYKHSDLVYPLTGGSIEITQVVIVKDSNGDIGLSSMCGEDGNWEWAAKGDWKYWMSVSALKSFNK